MRYLGQDISFSTPKDAEALTPAGSASWQVFANPVSLVVGGIAAVILELALPKVRHGVWDHSDFRRRPLGRMIRTAKAAMVTVYAPSDAAQAMIAQINHMHRRVSGITVNGETYKAFDTDLLNWVHATASFGFLEAYMLLVKPLSVKAQNSFYLEGQKVAALYGATGTPSCVDDQRILFARTKQHLEASETISDFLALTEKALPLPGFAARMVIRSAVGILPDNIVSKLELQNHRPTKTDTAWLRRAARACMMTHYIGTPAASACKRMGLPAGALKTSA